MEIRTLKQFATPVLGIGVMMITSPAIADAIVEEDDIVTKGLLYILITYDRVIMVVGGFLAGVSAFIKFYMPLQEEKSNQVIKRSVAKEALWDIDHLKIFSRSMFYKVQHAYCHHDLAELHENCTERFLSDARKIVAVPPKTSVGIGYIDVSETRIICCRNHEDDSKDVYVSYISGNISVTGSGSASLYSFAHTYHFARDGNRWLLNYIDQNVGVLDLLKLKSVYEK